MPKDIGFIVREMRESAAKEAVVYYRDPFKVLIATVLSQRTRDANTERAAKKLFGKYHTPKQLSRAPTASIQKLIRGSGFFRVKAARIKEISRHIAQNYNGKVPCDLDTQCQSATGCCLTTQWCVMARAPVCQGIPNAALANCKNSAIITKAMGDKLLFPAIAIFTVWAM